MKINLHDYGGYPFTRQLAESLAKRNHMVHYIYSDTTQMIKRGYALSSHHNLHVTPIVLPQGYKKYSLFQRRAAEIDYGKRVAYEIQRSHPDVVFSADAPLDTQNILLKTCDQRKSKFVFWFQDAIGLATRLVLSRKFPMIGTLIGRYYEWLEQRMVRQSNSVILITEDFLPLMKHWKVPQNHLKVIHNWAPLEELPVQLKRNPWALRMGLAEKFCFLYSGILGFKHNPELFIQLAEEFRFSHDVRIVVIAEGDSAKWLQQEKDHLQLEYLILLPYQPAEEYSQVLSAGDVLLTILNSEAGAYSVPSKVFSYLCACRPLLLSVPPENLAARLVSENQVGLVCSPMEPGNWLANARSLYEDPDLRASRGENGRAYAEKNFNIDQITDRFEAILDTF